MEVKACKKCGNLFNYIAGLPLCPACMKEIDDKFPEVKQYIYDHPRVGIQQVSEDNEVPVAIIKKWVKEERLTFAEGSAIGVECERCGKMILTGRFCEACKTEVKNAFGKMVSSAAQPPKQEKKQDSARMRFLK